MDGPIIRVSTSFYCVPGGRWYGDIQEVWGTTSIWLAHFKEFFFFNFSFCAHMELKARPCRRASSLQGLLAHQNILENVYIGYVLR